MKTKTKQVPKKEGVALEELDEILNYQDEEPTPAETENKKAEQSDEEIKEDILAALPKVENVAKPEQQRMGVKGEEEYFEEHKGLPTVEERPEQEVKEDEAEQIALREEAEKEIEAKKDEFDELSEAKQIEQAQAHKDEELLEVEAILQEGLDEFYQQMTPLKQQEFKQAGEQTATKVKSLLNAAKIKVHKIIELIKKWLQMIPGVNKYFLEQQSKIKTDELLKLKQTGE